MLAQLQTHYYGLDTVESGRLQTGSARKFRFLRCIGKGGFGEVYLAEMSTSSGFVKTVAIKVLREDVQDHEQVASRLRDEARLLGMLRHPAIVRADDLITIAGRPAVVMEYVPGVNFSWLINPKRCAAKMPPSVVLSIVRQVASALYAAYARPSPVTGEPLKVLHRDIKPGNIRITMDGEVKVLDFGIARSEHQGREADTQNYQLGSLRYMSPELMSGMGASPSSDIYALGVMTFEALARKRLGWAGEAPDVHDNQVQTRLEAVDLTAFPGESWNQIVGLLESMLAYEPDKRPSASHVIEQCRELERAVPGPALEVWALEVLPTVVAPDDPPDADLSGQTLWEEASAVSSIEPEPLELDPTDARMLPSGDTRSARMLLVMMVLAALVVAAMFGSWWFAFGPGVPEPAPDPVPPVQPPPMPPPEVPEPVAPVDPGAQAPADPLPGDPDVLDDPAREPAEPVPAVVEPAATAPAPARVEPAAAAPSEAAPAEPLAEPPPPAPAGDPIKVRFGSVPFGLMVYLDGALVGKTPKALEVTPGEHSLMFVDGERTQRQTIVVEPGGKTIWTYNSTRGDVQ
jgi:serine/threonine protein kinase